MTYFRRIFCRLLSVCLSTGVNTSANRTQRGDELTLMAAGNLNKNTQQPASRSEVGALGGGPSFAPPGLSPQPAGQVHRPPSGQGEGATGLPRDRRLNEEPPAAHGAAASGVLRGVGGSVPRSRCVALPCPSGAAPRGRERHFQVRRGEAWGPPQTCSGVCEKPAGGHAAPPPPL